MEEIFDTQLTFAQLGLKPEVLQGIAKQGFEHPTVVQARLIPAALAGRDVIAQSKTAAFGLPLLHMLDEHTPFASLILVPTRELAIQVTHEIRELGRFVPIKTMAVYGGQKMSVQISKLQKRPNIIVGTPGRVMDMHGRGMLPYDKVKVAILDEVDRMLDIGFREDIRKILGTMRQRHQTILVSATISSEIEKLANQYLRDPERLVLTTSKSLTVSQVRQAYFSIQPWEKNRLLVHLLTHEEPALTLVFCRTKQTVDALAEYLKRHDIDAHAIHGDMYQGQRDSVMRKLRGGELSVLVASDLAARGLDVTDITHVINYDLPEDPEIYVHRIGRTARAGRGGIAWSFVTPEQGALLTAIEMLTNVEIPRQEFADFQPGPVPPDILAARERAAARAEQIRLEQSRAAPPPPALVGDTDQSKFPGGLVPAARPSKLMGGRLRSRRR
jgi:ATP-dependent RNA helicase DeaD